jgi:hypothetical protein
MRWPVSTCSWVCAISTISEASCSRRPATTITTRSAAAPPPESASIGAASGAGSGWPPSTLSTTALSGHGASAARAISRSDRATIARTRAR